jgi:transcriptional regulator with XRE-family HTH domain
MLTTTKKKETNLPTVLRRMRESSELTMRQVGAMIGVSHVAISQFENRKLDLPDYRIEQMVKAYGFTMDEFNKLSHYQIQRLPFDDTKDLFQKQSLNDRHLSKHPRQIPFLLMHLLQMSLRKLKSKEILLG